MICSASRHQSLKLKCVEAHFAGAEAIEGHFGREKHKSKCALIDFRVSQHISVAGRDIIESMSDRISNGRNNEERKHSLLNYINKIS